MNQSNHLRDILYCPPCPILVCFTSSILPREEDTLLPRDRTYSVLQPCFINLLITKAGLRSHDSSLIHVYNFILTYGKALQYHVFCKGFTMIV